MQPTAQFTPFPWSALEVVDRRAEADLWIARRWLERVVQPAQFAPALGTMLGVEVRLFRGAVLRNAAGHWVELGFRPRDGGASCTLGMEPALAAALLSRVFKRSVPVLSTDARLEPAALGALSALIIEAARASDATVPLSACGPDVSDSSVAVQITAQLGGKPYAAVLRVTPERHVAPAADDGALLASLGDTVIELPLVVALGVTTARSLVALCPGAAFCAGKDTFIDGNGLGRGILAAGTSERGLEVELGPEGRIVLGEATRIALASAEEASMTSDDASEPPTLAQAVLDAPIVVRVELGSVSMSAREWAALRPGDVVQSGRRIGEPVLLRTGGRVVARGELVNVEGELGVRVIELGSDTHA